MRILKNILIYELPALMLCTTSCDYLDKEPENKVPEENVDFTQIENMYQAVSGVYAKVRTGGMHWVIWPLSVVRDDDVWSGRIDDQATLIDMGNYNYDSSFWGLNEMWNQYYGIIKVANAALESLDSYAENITFLFSSRFFSCFNFVLSSQSRICAEPCFVFKAFDNFLTCSSHCAYSVIESSFVKKWFLLSNNVENCSTVSFPEITVLKFPMVRGYSVIAFGSSA